MGEAGNERRAVGQRWSVLLEAMMEGAKKNGRPAAAASNHAAGGLRHSALLCTLLASPQPVLHCYDTPCDAALQLGVLPDRRLYSKQSTPVPRYVLRTVQNAAVCCTTAAATTLWGATFPALLHNLLRRACRWACPSLSWGSARNARFFGQKKRLAG